MEQKCTFRCDSQRDGHTHNSPTVKGSENRPKAGTIGEKKVAKNIFLKTFHQTYFLENIKGVPKIIELSKDLGNE